MPYVRTRSIVSLGALAVAVSSCGGGGSTAPSGGGGGGGGGGTGAVASVSINGNVTSLAVGATVTFTAAARDAGSNVVSTAAIVWSSSAPAVASVVASTGAVTGVSAGTMVLTAASGSIVGTRALSVTAAGGGGPFPSSARIDMPAELFVPNTIDIARTGTIEFVFTALAHDVIFSGSGAPTNIPVTANATVTRTFNTAGTFPILCTLHAGMTGSVIVH